MKRAKAKIQDKKAGSAARAGARTRASERQKQELDRQAPPSENNENNPEQPAEEQASRDPPIEAASNLAANVKTVSTQTTTGTQTNNSKKRRRKRRKKSKAKSKSKDKQQLQLTVQLPQILQNRQAATRHQIMVIQVSP